MFKEILIKLVGCFRSKVINLTRDHEADREDIDGPEAEHEAFEVKAMDIEGHDVEKHKERNVARDDLIGI
jgi:hypothetical protein